MYDLFHQQHHNNTPIRGDIYSKNKRIYIDKLIVSMDKMVYFMKIKRSIYRKMQNIDCNAL